MEKLEFITCTKNDLIQAFAAYNAAALENPEGFTAFDNTEDCAINQTTHLLSYISDEQKSNAKISQIQGALYNFQAFLEGRGHHVYDDAVEDYLKELAP